MTALGTRQRIEMRLARLLPLLSARTQVRLSGRPPVRIDGQTLEPEMQLMLSLIERQGRPPLERLPVEQARRELRAQAMVGGGTPPPVAAVRDLRVQGAAGPLPARLYANDEPGGRRPLIVFFHGGGFTLGDLDSHDVPCRLLCRHAGAHVLSVAYRLAPEHPFPAGVDDALAAFRWAAAHAAEIGADRDRIAVCGDSAGGNLSAVTAWRAAREGGPAPALQALFYPATDWLERAPSHALFEEGFWLTRSMMDWFADQYCADADPMDPRLSPLRADDLSGVAPAVVFTAGFDPLRDEGEAYAQALGRAGVRADVRRFPGLIHGFLNATGTSRVARDAAIEAAGAIRVLLAGAAVRERAAV